MYLFIQFYCSCRAVKVGPVWYIITSWYFHHNDVGQNEAAKTFKFREPKHPSNHQPDRFPICLCIFIQMHTHKSRYQQVQQPATAERRELLAATAWVQSRVCERPSVCAWICYHSSAPCSSWQMALPTLRPGVCVWVYCLGILGAWEGRTYLVLAAKSFSKPSNTHTHLLICHAQSRL